MIDGVSLSKYSRIHNQEYIKFNIFECLIHSPNQKFLFVLSALVEKSRAMRKTLENVAQIKILAKIKKRKVTSKKRRVTCVQFCATFYEQDAFSQQCFSSVR